MDSNLQSKLQQYSPTPPEGVWNKIADALDSGEDYARRLYAFEEQPPATAWPQLESALEENHHTKVVPFTKRFKIPLRYLAAASIIAVVLITISLTVRKTKAGDLQVANHSGAVATTTPVTPAKQNNHTAQTPNEQQEKTWQQTPVTDKQNGRIAASGSDAQAAGRPSAPSSGAASTVRYLMYDDGDGNLIRVSKKVAGLINCKDGDYACQQRLRQLRQTLATKATTADFTGILEMLHQLQQKP